MSYTVFFLPEVEADVVDGYLWYEQKAIGLGEDFLRLFYALSAEIGRNPLLYRCVDGNFRRRLMRRFPYAIYFKIDGSKVIVFALLHCARRPKTVHVLWDERTQALLDTIDPTALIREDRDR